LVCPVKAWQGRRNPVRLIHTQLKRLGSPNFTHLPVNRPRCPVHTFQQDGHMAFYNPTGRANYEPNSWGEAGGPPEDPERGYRSFAAEEGGGKLRERRELFADHYSEARQFYLSQTEVERTHIKDAFTFELSKVETLAIRAQMVAHLLNVDAGLAKGGGWARARRDAGGRGAGAPGPGRSRGRPRELRRAQDRCPGE
jgi:catalase